jgi:hypothetical protein
VTPGSRQTERDRNVEQPPTLAEVVRLSDPVVIVLAEGDTQSAINNAKGHLFEDFVARLLHEYGYSQPETQRISVTREGVEIDVTATHELTGHAAIAECKAYTSPVSAAMVGTFHSKLVTARYSSPDTQGYLVALPKLTANGHELADLIAKNDNRFKLLTAVDVVVLLRSRRAIVDCPIPDILISDPAVVISEHGVYAASLELDGLTRLPRRALIWAASGPVPLPVREALARDGYAQGVDVFDARESASPPTLPKDDPDHAPVIVTVIGSQSDFEYQLPASPRFFVGRRPLVAELTDALETHAGVVVLNAQSGWGKSSAALRLQALVDSRTASYKRFVTDALSLAAQEAAREGVLTPPDNASWASLSSALRTLRDATWSGGPLVVFFDQFENVFRDEDLTREFRDLALSARDLADRLLIGFAWKTDLVGWTESHPYQLRDQIRANARVITLGPLGASEVDTLLRRLEKAIDQPLARDLKTRLREYSQGLPWLFKKLAGHLLKEVQAGVTQERLAAEALNVQSLFDADLAELGPVEHEALKHIARHAPIAISEVMERVSGPVVETLVNRRLVVQVGERLDTYWDIFRDYLNSGRIPIEDSYILRQSPVSVTRLLREVLLDQGDSAVPDLAARMGTSENGVFNLSRELRLLGATSYEPNRVRILPEIWDAEDREAELRRRVAGSLRRHRAFSAFAALADRLNGVSFAAYGTELEKLFPAVEARNSTWIAYARTHLQWFEYAGLAVARGALWDIAPEGSPGVGELIGGRVVRRTRGGWPNSAPGPAVELLLKIARGEGIGNEDRRRGLRDLEVLGAVESNSDGTVALRDDGLVLDGSIVPERLRDLMSKIPGVSEGLAVIESDPAAKPIDVGAAVKRAVNADWAELTVQGVGKYLRAWAKLAGLEVKRVPRPTDGRTDLPQVRQWARENGYTWPTRGQVPGSVVAAYDLAHGSGQDASSDTSTTG